MKADNEVNAGNKTKTINNGTRRPFKRFHRPFVVEVELPKNEKGELDTQLNPVSKTQGSAGYDLHCNEESVTIEPGNRAIIDTGIKVKIPRFTVGWITSRSGEAAKHGVIVLNSPGEIDSDYRDNLKVILFNTGKESVTYKKYDRIAQITFMSVKKGIMKPVEVLSEDKFNEREGGLGSTGVSDTTDSEKKTA